MCNGEGSKIQQMVAFIVVRGWHQSLENRSFSENRVFVRMSFQTVCEPVPVTHAGIFVVAVLLTDRWWLRDLTIMRALSGYASYYEHMCFMSYSSSHDDLVRVFRLEKNFLLQFQVCYPQFWRAVLKG